MCFGHFFTKAWHLDIGLLHDVRSHDVHLVQQRQLEREAPLRQVACARRKRRALFSLILRAFENAENSSWNRDVAYSLLHGI